MTPEAPHIIAAIITLAAFLITAAFLAGLATGRLWQRRATRPAYRQDKAASRAINTRARARPMTVDEARAIAARYSQGTDPPGARGSPISAPAEPILRQLVDDGAIAVIGQGTSRWAYPDPN